jgi:hypothetical protein
MANIFLPQDFKIVSGTLGARTTNGGITGDIIDLKNAVMVWMVAHYQQAVSHATTIQPVVGISIASCATAITFACDWWKNADISATDTLVAQTAATSFACTAGATDQLVVIRIDPADVVAQLATYHCLGFTIASSGQANYVSVVYYIQERYPQATPPTAIV